MSRPFKKVRSTSLFPQRMLYRRAFSGAYILSPLQGAGRDVLQNYGFMVFYRPSNQVITRLTSYSVNNMASVPENAEGSGAGDPLTSSGTSRSSHINATGSTSIPEASFSPRPITRRPSYAHKRSLSGASAASGGRSSTKSRRPPRRSLSLLLTSTAPTAAGRDAAYVAFKALPVDHTLQEREEDGSAFTQPRRSEFGRVDRTVGKTCQEVVDDICEQLVEACDNAGLEGAHLLVEKDVVR
jgi:hypothetical protein